MQRKRINSGQSCDNTIPVLSHAKILEKLNINIDLIVAVACYVTCLPSFETKFPVKQLNWATDFDPSSFMCGITKRIVLVHFSNLGLITAFHKLQGKQFLKLSQTQK